MAEQISLNSALAPAQPLTVTPQQVYSSANIAQATTAPAAAPGDLLGIRTQISNELGLPGLQTDYTKTLNELTAAKTAAMNQNTAIENLPQALGVIRGEQAQAQNIASNKLQALADTANVKQQAIQAANLELAARYGIREQEVNQKRELMVKYPKAGITFGDSFESVTSKLGEYETKLAKDTKKDALKTSLMALGLKTSGSTKDMEKRLKKANKEAYKRTIEESDLKLQAARLQIAKTTQEMKMASAKGSDKKITAWDDKTWIWDKKINPKVRLDPGASFQENYNIIQGGDETSQRNAVYDEISKNIDAGDLTSENADEAISKLSSQFPMVSSQEIRSTVLNSIPQNTGGGFASSIYDFLFSNSGSNDQNKRLFF